MNRLTNRRSYIKGLMGEYYAMAYLCLRGYRCLHHRYKTPMGEVDLIMRPPSTSTSHPPTLVLIEVKVRKNMIDAHYAIGAQQKRRYKNIGRYIHQKYRGASIRYEAVLIAGLKITHTTFSV